MTDWACMRVGVRGVKILVLLMPNVCVALCLHITLMRVCRTEVVVVSVEGGGSEKKKEGG